jgi:hypothetical protein
MIQNNGMVLSNYYIMFGINVTFMKTEEHNFHSCTVHFGTIEVFYLPTDAHAS